MLWNDYTTQAVMELCCLHCNVYGRCVVARDVFKLLATKYKRLDLVVGASFFEIYSGKASNGLCCCGFSAAAVVSMLVA